MNAGAELFEAARAAGARSIVFVGTGKNVGKTVALRAVYEAAAKRRVSCGLASIGRDGEVADIGDAQPKPRLFVQPGTIVATARDVLPVSPAAEVLELSDLQTAAGALVYVRVVQPAFYELLGPPTASGVRQVIGSLSSLAQMAIVDGAIDRIAALAGGDDAIVVSCGASAAGTLQEAVDDVRALSGRLSLPRYESSQEFVRIDGALTATRVAELIVKSERRQIVVRDPTQIALGGRAFLNARERLHLCCERPLRVLGITVASIGRERFFEPRAFASAVAESTSLPVYDVYANQRTVA